MKPIRSLVAVALICLSFSAVRADPAAKASDGPSMASAVRMKVPAVTFKSVPLADVFDFMRDVGQLNIYINWPALEAAGIDRSTPVTINLKKIALSKVFDLTLTEAGQGRAGLSWYVSDNIIYVTTRELADRDLITLVYPVRDLLVDVPNFKGPTFQTGGGGGGSQSGGSVFSDSNDDTTGQAGQTEQVRGEKLVEIIKMLVTPEIWVDNGGLSQIRYFGGNIIVTAPRSVQLQIGR